MSATLGPPLPPPMNLYFLCRPTPYCVRNSTTARIHQLQTAKAYDTQTHFSAPVTSTLNRWPW